MTNREDIDALLAAATAPRPVAPPAKYVVDIGLLKKFLRDYGIESGPVISVEVSELYAMYRSWGTTLRQEPVLITTKSFARGLSILGFKRRRPKLRRIDRDRRCLMVSAHCAKELMRWAREHPLTDKERDLFRVKRGKQCNSPE